MNEHVRIILDRREVMQVARTHQRIYCEWSDKSGVRCVSTGYVAGLDAHVLIVEAGGKSTAIHLDRIHVFEAIGGNREAKVGGA
jgi:hypothetical protein